ncbi:MAG: dinitrogenase iron-molybdenum cofactor [Desulfobacteraceae bacterium]|nr:dinitrogenase iron-molybdenum cofactor [Desulfobacteraceae bacterium]
MKIAFPVTADSGLDSLINEHFGVAKKFMIVNLVTKEIKIVDNQKHLEENASCKTGVFGKEAVDAVVTKCIGDGSLRGLNTANIKVYAATKDTIAQNLKLLEKDELKLFHIFDLCQGKKNKKKGGCGHHH